MSTVSIESSSATLLSSPEVSKAMEYLIVTRDRLVETTSGLSDSQWHFKPEPGRWSIAEALEHLALIEDRVHGIVARMPEAPFAEPDRVNSQIEETIMAKVPDRSAKYNAPPPVQPSCQWNPAETLAHFLERRTRTLELLTEAPSLRGHVVPHPILGLWDGYQWILAVAAHTVRHTSQIQEVRESSGFPEAQAATSATLN